jgi:hypothetical protein
MLVCDWFGDSNKEIEWFVDPLDPSKDVNSEATGQEPVVYHIYGLEKYPGTIVISEDDYMDFLVKVSEDKEHIPLKLREVLGQPHASLLLLGYTLRGWDFRALFRGIIGRTMRSKPSGAFHFTVQLHPPHPRLRIDPKTQAHNYLEEYFDKSSFKVVWDTPTEFLKALVGQWEASQQ